MTDLTIPQGSPILSGYAGAPAATPVAPSTNAASYQPSLGRAATLAEAEQLASKPVSSVSSSNGADAIDNHIQNHKNDMATLPQPAPTTKTDTTTAPAANVDSTLKSQGGYSLDEVNSSGMDTSNFTYDPKTKYFLPKAATPDNGQAQYDADKKTISDAFNTQTAGMDAATANLVSSIKDIYDQRINDAKELNRGSLGAANAFNSTFGRYSPTGGSSALSLTEKSSMDNLTRISNEEASALAQAQQSLTDKKYGAFVEQRNQLSDLRKERLATLNKLNDQAIADKKAATERQQKVTDNISAVALEAAKNGADAQTQAAIKNAATESDAVAAAGNYLQSGTGTLGDYIQYKRDALSKGLVPSDYQTYKDKQDAKASQAKINEAVAIQNAKNKSDADFTASDKNQQKLEQQYRGVLSKEFSSRTGALGVENQKVNQANHLNSLFQQYYDPKTGDYNIPKSQYSEVVLGVANLIAPTGVASDSVRESLTQKTAKGDFLGAITYLTGTPQNGTTQDVIKNLLDSVDRQAETAMRNREGALQNLRDQAPTDLEQSRIDALNKSTKMVGYEGQSRLSKATVDDYVKQNPSEAENIAKLYEIPGATDQDIEDYLTAQGKIK